MTEAASPVLSPEAEKPTSKAWMDKAQERQKEIQAAGGAV